MEKLKILDLFSGIGGFSLGLERTGHFETTAFCEIDKDASFVLNKHWPQVKNFKDIKELTPVRGEYDVITGGVPCQDISFAGQRKGIIEGKRSSLWKEMLRIIEKVGPKYVIIENVEYLRKNGLGVILNDLSKIGYDSEWNCITAESVNYPHQRDRLFIISYPSSERQYEHFGKKRLLQTNKEWPSKEIHSKGKECEFKPISICPILSERAFDKLRSSLPCRKSFVSQLPRVTNGIPDGLDEKRRKARVKQLGNAIVPDIAYIIGMAIIQNGTN